MRGAKLGCDVMKQVPPLSPVNLKAWFVVRAAAYLGCQALAADEVRLMNIVGRLSQPSESNYLIIMDW